MASNYIIETEKGDKFGGWNQLGQIVIHNSEKNYPAYRMTRTLAMRNIDKVEQVAGCKCSIVKITD